MEDNNLNSEKCQSGSKLLFVTSESVSFWEQGYLLETLFASLLIASYGYTTVMVNFMRQLDWTKGYPTAG